MGGSQAEGSQALLIQHGQLLCSELLLLLADALHAAEPLQCCGHGQALLAALLRLPGRFCSPCIWKVHVHSRRILGRGRCGWWLCHCRGRAGPLRSCRTRHRRSGCPDETCRPADSGLLGCVVRFGLWQGR